MLSGVGAAAHDCLCFILFCPIPIFLSFFFHLVLGVLQGNSKDLSFVFESHLTFILS